MRTLRDEVQEAAAKKVKLCCPSPAYESIFFSGVDAALGEYGSYRVVEGVLTLGTALDTRESRLPPVVLFGGLPVGRLGDTVKLILPPEEKKPLGAKVAIDTAMALVREHAARADRYEKALVEIAAERTEGSGFAFWMKRRAKEALDGTDTE